ncbi:Nuclear envelope protein [Venustampulla echinocandica]|uniref:Nuclear envelope protein n=1 Tax=Venustampulla echinocandica TaxID=2656787 RepID=A0A370TQL6_9HELO|nr:Nuclear envelope protein [Venustampulla echinocandica]RDL37798.1 Nuclear envelope protein [Venustampulla echinocandica]
MPPAPRVVRVRPYKDFLTPALHRRFAMATAALFGLCYVEAVLIGEWNSLLWSWFPLGRAGLRTALLFIPAFMIFILRVSQLHVGLRTSYSSWQTFRTYFFRPDIVQTGVWYSLSAYLFSEIFIWSASKDADLNRINAIPKTHRPILNERPIYLTTFFYILAFVQAGCHIFYDYDRIDLPVMKTRPQASPNQTTHLVVPPMAQLKGRLPSLILTSAQRAIVVALVTPIVYSMDLGVYPYSIRKFAWSFTRSWASIFWNLPKTTSPPAKFPWRFDLIVRTMLSGFLLLMLWELGNAAFSVYVAQEPLKNERPITHESRDPNGSLLTGLRGKKLQTRAFAFWELALIAQNYEGRRKIIFEDLDRAGGSTWSQLRDVCLDVINGMESRIAEYQAPKPAADSQKKIPEPEPLPRLSEKPLKDGLEQPGDIFTSARPQKRDSSRTIEAIGRFAKRHGQSEPTSPEPKSKELLLKAESAVLTPGQQKALSDQGLVGLFKTQITWILNSRLGYPFRQEYRRKMAAIVLGTPYGDVGIIVDAADVLTRFAISSLTEDKYGIVHKDVKVMIQTFTKAIVRLEGFKAEIGVHWTDVEAKQESPEVDTILATLRGDLQALIDAFDEYAEDLKISRTEMRVARNAAASPAAASPVQAVPEMAHVS